MQQYLSKLQMITKDLRKTKKPGLFNFVFNLCLLDKLQLIYIINTTPSNWFKHTDTIQRHF